MLLVLEVGYSCSGDVGTADGAVGSPACIGHTQDIPVSAAAAAVFQNVYSSVCHLS